MGNCQAVDAAALVIQRPDGKVDRMYWPVTASEVMRSNPGHYVSLIIPFTPPVSDQDEDNATDQKSTVRFTRVKLLRPTDTLTLGHAYKLITTQEVMKVLRAKKYAKMKQQQIERSEKQSFSSEAVRKVETERTLEYMTNFSHKSLSRKRRSKISVDFNISGQQIVCNIVSSLGEEAGKAYASKNFKFCDETKDMAAFVAEHLRVCKLTDRFLAKWIPRWRLLQHDEAAQFHGNWRISVPDLAESNSVVDVPQL